MRFAVLSSLLAGCVFAVEPFRIEIVDKENGWPVPLVELQTTHHMRFVTDNSGLVAMDVPDLFNREVYFHVKSHGYGVAKDGFGYEGFRVTPSAGGRHRVEIDRRIVAKRIGRLTGAGLFAEAIKLGEKPLLPESGVFGCDSIQLVNHRGRLLHFWGDTTLAKYPLGIFDMTAAATPLNPLESFKPPLAMKYNHFRNENGDLRGVAKFPGDGPTWLGGFISLPLKKGGYRLVAYYSKIRNHLEEYELGLCIWDDVKNEFAVQKVVWRAGQGEKPPMPRGHPFRWTDGDGREWVLFGDPFPELRMPANYESWMDSETWETIPLPAHPRSAQDGSEIKPHRGSVAWNAHRNQWISIFTQYLGSSPFGELWYAEAGSPLGPWGPAVKVLGHDNYTFYNPRILPEYTPADAPFIFFEGTYTAEFADRAMPTPRYNYNQILYRVDLDDPALEPARK